MEYTTGDWVEYDAMTRVKGVAMSTGKRFGIVISEPKGQLVRIVTNSPKPQIMRLNIDEVTGLYRSATIKECSDRISEAATFGSPPSVRAGLRDAREALRVRRDAE